MISYDMILGFPPFRQEKGERMGYGAGTKTSGQRPSRLRTYFAAAAAGCQVYGNGTAGGL
jgi:hypothetical protein